jgi:tetratricopeptide (TPR) repeat protein
MGQAWGTQGRWSSAWRIYAEVDRLLAAMPHRPSLPVLAERELAFGKALWDRGDATAALARLRRADALLSSRRFGDEFHLRVRILTFLAERLLACGRNREAANYLRRAVGQINGHIQLEGVVQRTHGFHDLAAGYPRKAADQLQAALPNLIADRNGEILACLALSEAFLRLGEPVVALDWSKRAHAQARAIRSIVRRAQALVLLSECERRLGHYRTSRAFAHRARRLAVTIPAIRIEAVATQLSIGKRPASNIVLQLL